MNPHSPFILDEAYHKSLATQPWLPATPAVLPLTHTVHTLRHRTGLTSPLTLLPAPDWHLFRRLVTSTNGTEDGAWSGGAGLTRRRGLPRVRHVDGQRELCNGGGGGAGCSGIFCVVRRELRGGWQVPGDGD